jgi:uncharacterized protein DUF5670
MSTSGCRTFTRIAEDERKFLAEIFAQIDAFQCCHTKQLRTSTERNAMLWTIFVILLVLWLLGLVSSYTLGGFIHILLVIAVVVLIINLIQGRRPL